jgi:hypothetical protein
VQWRCRHRGIGRPRGVFVAGWLPSATAPAVAPVVSSSIRTRKAGPDRSPRRSQRPSCSPRRRFAQQSDRRRQVFGGDQHLPVIGQRSGGKRERFLLADLLMGHRVEQSPGWPCPTATTKCPACRAGYLVNCPTEGMAEPAGPDPHLLRMREVRESAPGAIPWGHAARPPGRRSSASSGAGFSGPTSAVPTPREERDGTSVRHPQSKPAPLVRVPAGLGRLLDGAWHALEGPGDRRDSHRSV